MEHEGYLDHENHLFTRPNGEKVYGTSPPPDIKKRVADAQRRDFDRAQELLGKKKDTQTPEKPAEAPQDKDPIQSKNETE